MPTRPATALPPEPRALAPLVRALPMPTTIGAVARYRLDHACLALGNADAARDALSAVAGPGATSRSASGAFRALLAAQADRCGLDVETLDRVGMNARIDDPWLSPIERAVVAYATQPLLEIGCRWVLKEAYGKALGLGLALPLDALTFEGRGGAIALNGPAAPSPAWAWRFALFRCGDVLFGVALGSKRSGNAVGSVG